MTRRALVRALRSFQKPVPTPRPAGRLKAAQSAPTARYRAILAAATLALALAACTSAPAVTPSPPPTASGSLPAGWVLPDHALTPGAIGTTDETRLCPHVDPALEAARPSSSDKAKVYQAYGLSYPQPHGRFELDHLVPIELGGAPNDPANEWPELNVPPDPATARKYGLSMGFLENPKDILEDVLHDDVCSGKVPLSVAQQAIAANWIEAYVKYVGDAP